MAKTQNEKLLSKAKSILQGYLCITNISANYKNEVKEVVDDIGNKDSPMTFNDLLDRLFSINIKDANSSKLAKRRVEIAQLVAKKVITRINKSVSKARWKIYIDPEAQCHEQLNKKLNELIDIVDAMSPLQKIYFLSYTSRQPIDYHNYISTMNCPTYKCNVLSHAIHFHFDFCTWIVDLLSNEMSNIVDCLQDLDDGGAAMKSFYNIFIYCERPTPHDNISDTPRFIKRNSLALMLDIASDAQVEDFLQKVILQLPDEVKLKVFSTLTKNHWLSLSKYQANLEIGLENVNVSNILDNLSSTWNDLFKKNDLYKSQYSYPGVLRLFGPSARYRPYQAGSKARYQAVEPELTKPQPLPQEDCSIM